MMHPVKQENLTIELTSSAAKKYRSILEEEGKKGFGLRFGMQGGGCRGIEYFMDYSEKAKSDDQVFISQGIEIHVNQEMLSELAGCVIDYVEAQGEYGFKITNPNVKSGCGCNKSGCC